MLTVTLVAYRCGRINASAVFGWVVFLYQFGMALAFYYTSTAWAATL